MKYKNLIKIIIPPPGGDNMVAARLVGVGYLADHRAPMRCFFANVPNFNLREIRPKHMNCLRKNRAKLIAKRFGCTSIRAKRVNNPSNFDGSYACQKACHQTSGRAKRVIKHTTKV